jgi:two-component system sensor histidine kinase BarA
MDNRQFRILIVDDNPEFVLSFKSLINDIAGYQKEIMIAHNGYDALQLIRDNTFDYVFMDIKMADMDGIEATRLARFEFDNQNMKIIGVSFNSDLRYKSQMILAGANGYFTKDEIDADRLVEIFNINQNELL